MYTVKFKGVRTMARSAEVNSAFIAAIQLRGLGRKTA